jgi:hypothetical protein
MEIDINSEKAKVFLKKLFANFPQKTFNNVEIEQICYRMYLCEKCIENEKCIVCECNPHDVLGETFSCNHEKKFPNFFPREIQWIIFKQEHNIRIK